MYKLLIFYSLTAEPLHVVRDMTHLMLSRPRRQGVNDASFTSNVVEVESF